MRGRSETRNARGLGSWAYVHIYKQTLLITLACGGATEIPTSAHIRSTTTYKLTDRCKTYGPQSSVPELQMLPKRARATSCLSSGHNPSAASSEYPVYQCTFDTQDFPKP